MKQFQNGVSYYTKGTRTETVYFPENDVICYHCPNCYQDSVGRYMCRALNRELYSIMTDIDRACPLDFEEGNNEKF